jgi:DNA-binding winged helix-turn-helix (wHTH) protein/TolB-like protein
MTRRFRFGLFALDAERGELRRENVPVRLQSQPTQALIFLVEHAGQVVSREELRKAVWGEATFVDFDAGLNFCMSQIRSALRDDSAQPVFIRTVPKSGYQFIAPVERVAEPMPDVSLPLPAEQNSASREPRVTGSTRPTAITVTRRWILLGAAAVALVAFTLWVWRARYVLGGQPAPILAVARFDNETGDVAMNRLADGLTDNLVAQLTMQSNAVYRVIGNAQILRVAREQRDLRAIAASLGAGYLVLGQVQTNGEQLRILAHLIRLPDQTHIWVVRLDHPRGDELKLEAEAAASISTAFASRMAQQPEKAPSFGPGSH